MTESAGYYKQARVKRAMTATIDVPHYGETVDDILALARPFRAVPSRGISERVCRALGIRTRSDEFGDVVAWYFPYYKLSDGDPVLVGFKRKSAANAGGKSTYTTIGDIDVNCLLFGAVVHDKTTGAAKVSKATGKPRIIITEGEFDCAACIEAQLEHGKGDFGFPVFTSIGFGTANAVQHISARINQEFLKTFDKPVIAFDNDCATETQLRKGVIKGQEALKAVADYLGEANITVCPLPPEYDPNDLLVEKRSQELFWGFTKPKPYSVAGFIEYSQIEHMATKMPALGRPFPWPSLTKLTLGRRLGEGFYFGAGCVDADTEYLSPTGWVKISEYQDGSKVSQYNTENGKLEFVVPGAYTKAPAGTMLHIKTKYGVDQVLSGEHRFAFWAESNTETNKPSVLPFYKVATAQLNNATGFRGLVKTTFEYSGDGVDFTEAELRLQVAVMADGRIVKNGANNYTQMRFKKERKYIRLLEICKTGGLQYRDNGVNNQGYYEVIVFPKTNDKVFDSKYYTCTQEQLQIIADELPRWDGTTYSNGSRRYFSAEKESIDFAQFCYSAIGQRCTVKIYDKPSAECATGYFGTLFIGGKQFVGIRGGQHGNPPITEYQSADGHQYCFTVPSGFLILRRNGCVFVTGNTKVGKSECLNQMVQHILETEDTPPAVFKFEEEPHITCKKLAGKLYHKQFTNPEKVLFIDHNGKEHDVWGNPIHPKFRNTYFTETELKEACDAVGDKVIYYNNYGSARWEDVAEKIRHAVTVRGCKDVFIDPLTRLTAGMAAADANSELERIADSISTMSKDLGFTYYFFCHLKAPMGNNRPHEKGGAVESVQFTGSRAMMRAAYYMIGIERDKSDGLPEIVRNMSNLVLLEDRAFGRTGRVALYYDTHTGDYREPTPDEVSRYEQALLPEGDK